MAVQALVQSQEMIVSDTLHKHGIFHQKMGEDLISKRGWGYHGKQMLMYLFITHLITKIHLFTDSGTLIGISWHEV